MTHPQREALLELASLLAEVATESWIERQFAGGNSVDDVTTDVDNHDYQKSKTPNRQANSAE